MISCCFLAAHMGLRGNSPLTAKPPVGTCGKMTLFIDHLVIIDPFNVVPETFIKRQATRHDCLPSLMGDGDK
jgi:hypothetical protein